MIETVDPVCMSAISVGLHVEGAGALAIELCSDGDLLRRVQAKITPQLLVWCGHSSSEPAPSGNARELVIAFKGGNGRQLTMRWQVDSDLPQEVVDFVESVLDATHPECEQHWRSALRHTRRAGNEWWKFFCTPPI